MTLQLRQRMLILYQRLFLISLFYSGRSDHPLLAIYISKKPSKPITSPYVSIILCFFLFSNKFLFFYLYFQSKQYTVGVLFALWNRFGLWNHVQFIVLPLVCHSLCIAVYISLLPSFSFLQISCDIAAHTTQSK